MRRSRLYIPLCFLLILVRDPDADYLKPPLHSTMFSINHVAGCQENDIPFALHSTMFSINRQNASAGHWHGKLYIPLCFLLIHQSTLWHATPFGTLHSTMFSINQFTGSASSVWLYSLHSTMFSINPKVRVWKNMTRRTLYIPLCFLLIVLHPQLLYPIIALYIPLCFLLIVWYPAPFLRPSWLYIPLCFLLIPVTKAQAANLIVFTFHYVFY